LNGWKQNYPPSKYPVLAFTGAPAEFPIEKENVKLQKYLKWSDQYESKANDFVKNVMNNEKFIGLHLRNGHDFV
jgi:peptide-O-fucosyltransferase